MENEISSNIINKENITLSKESIKENNDNNIKLEDNLNIDAQKALEDKNNSLKKVKDILDKLLKDSFEQKLTLLEAKANKHSYIIKTTLETTKSITNLSIKMNKQIQEKIKKDKEKKSKSRTNRYGVGFRKGLSPNKSAISNTRSNFYRAKTPSHISKPGTRNNKTPNIYGLKKELMKSKSNMTLVKNSKSTLPNDNKNSRRYNVRRKSMGKKNKSSINFNNSNLDDLHTMSVSSIKTNKTNTTTLNTLNNSRINNNIYNKNKKRNTEINLRQNLVKSKDIKRRKSGLNNYNLSEKNLIHISKKNTFMSMNNIHNDDKKNKRKKTPFNKKNNNNNNDNESMKMNVSSISYSRRNDKSEDEMDDILTLENNLQKDELINNNDPLLILPLKDLDFVPKGLLKKNNLRDSTISNLGYKISSFDISQNIEKIKFKNIFDYLNLNELLPIKNVSKEFHQMVLWYFVEYLEKEKSDILIIKNSLNITEIPTREGIENMELSKGSKKATQLLNESLLNHLFKDEKIPVNDIILVYRIYFQMINHPFAKIAKIDIDKFWEKCKFYFTNEQNGKTGDILTNMINKKKIEVNGNNLYQIYNLVKGNFNKIVPNYFSSICGTTGLFVFIIKDVLEFLGFSQKIKKKENAYWTYMDIIDSINEKINLLKISKI